MNVLEVFVRTPMAAVLGWVLLHSLWQGVLVSAALAATLLLTRSPRIRYAAACAALMLIVIAVSLTCFRLIPVGIRSQLPAPALHLSHISLGAVAFHRSGWGVSLSGLAPWLAPFWLAGVFAFYLRQAAGFFAVHRLRHRGVCSAPEAWQSELARLAARLRLSRPVILLQSCLTDAPVVIGHFQPLILLPLGVLSGLSPVQIESILLHELEHIRRHDYLVNTLQRLIEGFFFYHPAVWWICSVIRAERENCCDDTVVAFNGKAREYASALAEMERNRCSVRQPAIAATGGNLMKRVRRLLDPSKPKSAGSSFLAAILLLATAAVTLTAWQSQPTAAEPTKDSGIYASWLNSDVVYIINDAERAAFLRLSNDAERNKFIEQFWLRRDPTPGTPENEFKDEHYRRIAFANKHFKTASGRPGWQTDRGYIYVVYGPPDEIDAHPQPANGLYAYESWGYRHTQNLTENGIITFIDRTGEGDYHLAPGNSR